MEKSPFDSYAAYEWQAVEIAECTRLCEYQGGRQSKYCF